MKTVVFSFPTPICFGAGALAELPAKLRGMEIKRPLVVTDARLPGTEAFGRLQETLGKAAQGAGWFLFHDVHPNPIEEDVIDAAAFYRQHDCDGVIGFGGGSALDAAKAARLLIKRPELMLRRYTPEMDWAGLAPFIGIPTTAGTGSEVGRSSVIILSATRRKAVFFHRELLARLVILDPELTMSLPPSLTAATGADALTHCIESFTSPVFQPMCDGIALEGIHLIMEALPAVCQEGADLESRGKMLVAASMGGIAFQKDLGAAHSLAHPLSALCGMHHGTANAICLPRVMRFNAERHPGLYRRVGLAGGMEVAGLSAAEADQLAISMIETLFERIGLNQRLGDLGVSRSQLDDLAAQAFEDSCHRTNPVPVSQEDLRRLYLAAL